MTPLQMKGTHALCASNASVGAVHTLSRVASKAPVGESKVMMLQATPCRTKTSPECHMAAIKHLQELEAKHLDLNHLIALVDYFKSSSDATITYLSLDLPILCHGWLQKQLVQSLGFPPLPSLVDAGSSGEGDSS